MTKATCLMFHHRSWVYLTFILSSSLYAQHRERQNEIFYEQRELLDTSKHTSHQQWAYIAQLKSCTKNSELLQFGFHVARRIDDENVIIILKEQKNVDSLSSLFQHILPINNLWKLSPTILTTNDDTDHIQRRDYLIKVRNDLSLKTWSLLASFAARRLHNNLIQINCTDQNILDSIVDLDDVLYIGVESLNPHEEARVIDLNLIPNKINLLRNKYPNYQGEGMTASIKEMAYRSDDLDLLGRTVNSGLTASEESDHATEMATIVGGAGNSFVTGLGVAPRVMLTSSDFAELLPDDTNDYLTLDVGVQNHSYGTEIENFYGALAEAYDHSSNENKSLLHIFSSGNEGTSTSSTGTYAGVSGFANLTGNFKMAKNALVVGCVDTVGREVFFSSRGPAHDGRIKPEVVAYSTAGSSNAAALVTGTVVLMQQAYREKYGELPPSALVRGLLINSATDAGPAGLDHTTGFGNIDAYHSIKNLLDENFFAGTVNNSETVQLPITIPVGIKSLQITLTWNDPAALVNSNHALVNDLDITVLDPEAALWLPWKLKTEADATQLAMNAERSEDHLNNVEKISIDAPSAGQYMINVHGYDIPDGPQQFFVTWQVDTTNQFNWTHPTSSDNIPYDGETTEYLRWESTLSSATGKLAYTTDDGLTWNTIENVVDLSSGYYRWPAPDVTSVAQVRMTVGVNDYVSDPFTISRPVHTKIGFNCTDSVMLQWNVVDGASGYQLWTLDGNYLEPFITQTDTALILDKAALTGRLFAVQPVIENSRPALRGYTFDYATQGVDCFLNTFIAQAEEDLGVRLTVTLGTTYSVAQIVFERYDGATFRPLGNIGPVQNITSDLVDEQPLEGLNRYRVRIILENGATVVSQEADVLFLSKLPYLLYPNPVLRNSDLEIFTRESQNLATFELYDRHGRILLSQHLQSSQEVIAMRDVAPGLYIYTIISSEGRRYSGRIVVL